MTRSMRTPKKKTTFLEALRDGYSVTGAASKAGVGRRTVYGWREIDEQFANDWDDAWESRGDWYEDQNRTQARTGNMAAILNGLKIHGRIRDNVRNEVVGPNGGPIQTTTRYTQMSDEELNGRISELVAGRADRTPATDGDSGAAAASEPAGDHSASE